MKKEVLGKIAIIVSCLIFACVSVLVKHAAVTCSGITVSFFRFVLGAVLAIAAIRAFKKDFKINNLRAWILRGVFGAAAMVTCYWAIQLTSSGRAVLFSNTYPVFVAIYGFLFFKEKTSWNHWIGLVFCISGMFCVFYDGSQYSLFGNSIALSSGILGGFAVHYIREARQTNNPFSVYLSACLFGLLAGGWAWPEISEGLKMAVILSLILVGVLAFIAQIMMTYGYKYVSAAQGSVLGFLETVFTIMLSYLLTGEEMNRKFWLGAALIITGLLINTLTAKPRLIKAGV